MGISDAELAVTRRRLRVPLRRPGDRVRLPAGDVRDRRRVRDRRGRRYLKPASSTGSSRGGDLQKVGLTLQFICSAWTARRRSLWLSSSSAALDPRCGSTARSRTCWGMVGERSALELVGALKLMEVDGCDGKARVSAGRVDAMDAKLKVAATELMEDGRLGVMGSVLNLEGKRRTRRRCTRGEQRYPKPRPAACWRGSGGMSALGYDFGQGKSAGIRLHGGSCASARALVAGVSAARVGASTCTRGQ